MKKIKLTNRDYTTVDNEDFEFLNKWKWRYAQGRAVRTYWVGSGHTNRKLITIFLHRVVNKTPNGYDTDHINRNPLDNRKQNLRTATHSQNLLNRPKQKNNRSGYKNIFWDKQTKKWRVQFQIGNKTYSVGRFVKLSDAILERNKKWIK